MYVVRDKNTKKIIHINNAPLSQELTGEDVYYQYDAQTMEIGKTDDPTLPEHYKFTDQGEIKELSTQEKVEAGIITIERHQEVKEEDVVEKSLSQQVSEGLVILESHQKLIETVEGEIIAEKTPTELINENLLILHPTQKIIGEGADEQIVEKTLEEQLADGALILDPGERIVDNKVVAFTPKELHDQEFIDLEEYKKMMIDHYSEMSFELREELIPEYKLTNASLGLYDESEKADMTATVEAFRNEFYRIKELIENATSAEVVHAITENYPRSILTAGA